MKIGRRKIYSNCSFSSRLSIEDTQGNLFLPLTLTAGRVTHNLDSSIIFSTKQVHFQTKIFHPNISSNGSISMAILREDWYTSITMLKVSPMLIDPILDEAHPNVPDIVEMYKNDRAMYESTA
ncbi:hypothetical protein BUALT_Bualt01G0120300 [Buddleja alternifolia]|uniref:UBC core domain-containing protein n=1 Tax=Buddleja alternifolia TaxID=168488 RepID=A0AAV6Y6I5_9LAMI|nr:hypothetical protein BUALT_Bualt01G0120300 [Buddleja alternifolia]